MGFCDGCNIICTVNANGRCAKTDMIVGRIVQKWNNKEQQRQLATGGNMKMVLSLNPAASLGRIAELQEIIREQFRDAVTEDRLKAKTEPD